MLSLDSMQLKSERVGNHYHRLRRAMMFSLTCCDSHTEFQWRQASPDFLLKRRTPMPDVYNPGGLSMLYPLANGRQGKDEFIHQETQVDTRPEKQRPMRDFVV